MRRTFHMISIFVPYITIHIYTLTTYTAIQHTMQTFMGLQLLYTPEKDLYYSNYCLDLKIPFVQDVPHIGSIS